jgi:hypothetical protein
MTAEAIAAYNEEFTISSGLFKYDLNDSKYNPYIPIIPCKIAWVLD